MNKIIYLIVLTIFIISCGSKGDTEKEIFNTIDYVYVIVRVGKTVNTPNRESNLFKVNGKTEEKLKDNFDYVNSLLTAQGHPFNLDSDSDEIYTFKIKAKNIKEIVDTYKITIDSNSEIVKIKSFEYIGLGVKNAWCWYKHKIEDVRSEADFGDVKLVFIDFMYKHSENLEYAKIEKNGQLHDKLTGIKDDTKNALNCADGIGVWHVEY